MGATNALLDPSPGDGSTGPAGTVCGPVGAPPAPGASPTAFPPGAWPPPGPWGLAELLVGALEEALSAGWVKPSPAPSGAMVNGSLGLMVLSSGSDSVGATVPDVFFNMTGAWPL